VIGVVFNALLRDGRMMASTRERFLQTFGVSQSIENREILVRISKHTVRLEWLYSKNIRLQHQSVTIDSQSNNNKNNFFFFRTAYYTGFWSDNAIPEEVGH